MGTVTQQDLIDAAKSIGLEVAYSREWYEEPTPRLENGHGKIWNPRTDANDLMMLICGLGIDTFFDDDRVAVSIDPFPASGMSASVIYPDGKTYNDCTPEERPRALSEACVKLAANIERAKVE